jgi:uncharacterized protein YegL
MDGEKIQTLNFAVQNAIPEMQKVALENPNANIKVRSIAFSSGASWHIKEPVPIETFEWEYLDAGGVTDMGEAFELLAQGMGIDAIESRALPPVLVLLSDGQPTDDYMYGLGVLNAQPWARKAIRIAIAIGSDCDYDVLDMFLGSSDIKPLAARNASSLADYIKWTSTIVLQNASMPVLVGETGGDNQPVMVPPVVDIEEVW